MGPSTSGNAESVISDARALLAQAQPAEAVRKLRYYLASRPGTAAEQMLLGAALSQSGEGLVALQAFEQRNSHGELRPAGHVTALRPVSQENHLRPDRRWLRWAADFELLLKLQLDGLEGRIR